MGLDLSARTDLTAAVASALDDDGNVHLLPFCYTPQSGLEERARRDRAPYDVWVKQGLLIAVPGASIDYDWLCEHLTIALARMNIASVQFDRWRIDVFKAAAERTGFARLVGAWQEVGQGFEGHEPARRGLRVGAACRACAPRWPPAADHGRGQCHRCD